MTSDSCSQGCLPIMVTSNPANHEPKRIILSISCLLLGFYHIKEKKQTSKQMRHCRLLTIFFALCFIAFPAIYMVIIFLFLPTFESISALSLQELQLYKRQDCIPARYCSPVWLTSASRICSRSAPPCSLHRSDLRGRKNGLEPKLCNQLTS